MLASVTSEVQLELFRVTVVNTRKQPEHPRVDYRPCSPWTRGFNAAAWEFLNDFPGAWPVTNPPPPDSENATYM